MKRPMIEYIIEALEPTFAECIQDGAWSIRYGAGLILAVKSQGEDFISAMNDMMLVGFGAKYDALVDVASCLESLCPEEYSGRFMY